MHTACMQAYGLQKQIVAKKKNELIISRKLDAFALLNTILTICLKPFAVHGELINE